MRRLCSFFLLVLPSLLAGGVSAQVNHPYNEVGIYAVERPEGCASAQVAVAAGDQVTCYLVLTNPYSEGRERPIATVGGLECRYVVTDDVIVLGGTYPPGSSGSCFPPPGQLLIGCRVPVVGDQCVLFTMVLSTFTGGPGFIYLQPVAEAPQSIPGEMAFTDYDDDFSLHVMHPVSGSFDVPVFAINWDGDLSFCETVPTRAASFGTVKALYR